MDVNLPFRCGSGWASLASQPSENGRKLVLLIVGRIELGLFKRVWQGLRHSAELACSCQSSPLLPPLSVVRPMTHFMRRLCKQCCLAALTLKDLHLLSWSANTTLAIQTPLHSMQVVFIQSKSSVSHGVPHGSRTPDTKASRVCAVDYYAWR